MEYVAVDCGPSGRSPASPFPLLGLEKSPAPSYSMFHRQERIAIPASESRCHRLGGTPTGWHMGEGPPPVPSLHKLLFQIILLEGSCWKENSV